MWRSCLLSDPEPIYLPPEYNDAGNSYKVG